MSQLPPLEAISAKETEIRQRLAAARAQAEADKKAALTAAGHRLEQARQAGQVEAKAHYQQGMAQAEQEAAAIIAGAHAEAAALRRQAESRLDDAARRLVELITTTAGA